MARRRLSKHYSILFEGIAPGERATPDYDKWSDEEQAAIRVSIDLGYLREDYEPWRPEYDEPVPDGRDYHIRITGLGFQFLELQDAPWFYRAWLQIRGNLETIIVSVTTAVLIALVLQNLGLKE